MKTSKETKLFDRRTFKRHIKKGLITDKDRQSYLASLPDDAKNFEEVPFEDPNELVVPISSLTEQLETATDQTENQKVIPVPRE